MLLLVFPVVRVGLPGGGGSAGLQHRWQPGGRPAGLARQAHKAGRGRRLLLMAATGGYDDGGESSSGDELSVVEPTGVSSRGARGAAAGEKAPRALMASLRKPRKSFKNLDRDYGAQAEVRAPDGRVIRPR